MESAVFADRIFGEVPVFLWEENGNTVSEGTDTGNEKMRFGGGQDAEGEISREAFGKLSADSGGVVSEFVEAKRLIIPRECREGRWGEVV